MNDTRKELLEEAKSLAYQVEQVSLLMSDDKMKNLDSVINNLNMVLMMHRGIMNHYLDNTDEDNKEVIESKRIILQSAKLDLISSLTKI